MNYLIKSLLLSILVCVSSHDVTSQSYTVGDSLYIYSTGLERPIDDITNVSIYDFQFPCIDILVIEQSDLPHIDYQYSRSDGHKAYYATMDGLLLSKGYYGSDPYFNIPETHIQYFGGIPVKNTSQLEDINRKGKASFFLQYKAIDLPDDIQNSLLVEGISSIRLEVEIEWETSYGSIEDTYFIGDPLSVYKVNTRYSLSPLSIEIKKNNWSSIERSSSELLNLYFADKVYSYVSYFNVDDNNMLAKVSSEPNYEIVFISTDETLSLTDCEHKGIQLYVYPNPTYGALNIKYNNIEAEALTFSLYNIVGIKLWSESTKVDDSGKTSILLPSVEKGVYLYCVKDQNGEILQSRRLTVIIP